MKTMTKKLKHYNEPWKTEIKINHDLIDKAKAPRMEDCYSLFIIDSAKKAVCVIDDADDQETSTFERIVDCVNICGGIPSDRLVENLKTTPNNIRRIQELEKQVEDHFQVAVAYHESVKALEKCMAEYEQNLVNRLKQKGSATYDPKHAAEIIALACVESGTKLNEVYSKWKETYAKEER